MFEKMPTRYMLNCMVLPIAGSTETVVNMYADETAEDNNGFGLLLARSMFVALSLVGCG
jgi:hypothetical protein